MEVRAPYSFAVTKVDENKYIVRAISNTDSFPLNITAGDKAVFTKYYRVRTLELPSVRLGGIDMDSVVNKHDLVRNPFVTLGIKFLNVKALSLNNELSSYSLLITDERGRVLYDMKNSASQLSGEQISLIKSLNPGSILELKNVMVPGTRNPYQVKGLKLTIR